MHDVSREGHWRAPVTSRCGMRRRRFLEMWHIQGCSNEPERYRTSLPGPCNSEPLALRMFLNPWRLVARPFEHPAVFSPELEIVVETWRHARRRPVSVRST